MRMIFFVCFYDGGWNTTAPCCLKWKLQHMNYGGGRFICKKLDPAFTLLFFPFVMWHVCWGKDIFKN